MHSQSNTQYASNKYAGIFYAQKTRIMDITNSDNWQIIADWDLHANKPSGYITYPFMIGEKILDIDGNRPLIAITTSTASVEPEWKFAGYLRRKLFPNLGGSQDMATLSRKDKIPLNETKLFLFGDSFVVDYALSISIFLWIQHIEMKVYQYIGSDISNSSGTDNTELLNTINTNVLAIGEVLGVGES